MIKGGENLEIILIYGHKKSTYSEPLAEYLISNKIFFANNFNYSRGYIGTWELTSNKLYLIELLGHIQKEGGSLNDTYKVNLDYLFNENRVFAKWFTGEITVNDGEIIEYSYRGSYPKFEFSVILSFKKGELQNKKIINNKTRNEEQISTKIKNEVLNFDENIFNKAFGEKRNNRYSISEINSSQQISDEILQKIDFSAIYINNGDLNQALNAIETNILILKKINSNNRNYIQNKDFWKMYAFKAFILESTHNYKNAIDYYQLAIETAFDDIKVYALYHQIGWCFLNLKNDKKAIEFYTYAIDLKKQHPNSENKEDLEGIDNGVILGKKFEQMYVNRGNSLKNIGKLEDARQDCISAIEYNKQYSNPYLLLSQIFDLAGQKEKSMELLKYASDLGNQNAIRIYRNGGF